MSNRLYIDRVRVVFLDANTRTDDDLYGLWIGNDYEEFPVLFSPKEGDIPRSLQSILRHLHREDEYAPLDLIKEHVANGKELCLSGKEISAKRVKTILEQLEREEK